MDAKEIKNLMDSDAKEVAKILESLDEMSLILAKTYLSALGDVQRMTKKA